MVNQKFQGTNILSVDIGTSSVRACLVDCSLKILYQSSRAIQLETDAAGKAELNADRVLEKTQTCMWEASEWAEIRSLHVDAVSFSSASASLVPLDAAFKPIRPALTFADLRSVKESHWLINTYGKQAFTHTGAPMHASYWLPKLLWLRNQGLNLEGDLYFCTIKDLLIYRLTGCFMIDTSNAGAVGMMDARKMAWDDLSLEISGINTSQLPEIQPTTTLLTFKSNQADRLDRKGDSPKIVLGAMDGVLASLGVGAYQPGQVTTSLGSSGACRIAVEQPLIGRSDHRIWSYPLLDDLWIRGGAMNNGGLVTQWLTENFSENRQLNDLAYSEMLQAASSIGPGSDGLLFLPYLFGERAPIYNEQARGVYFGLHNRHNRRHFARAGLEGILFALFSIYEILQEAQGEVHEIRAAGGYLQSELMLQMQADIFGQPILIPAEQEGSVIGAAVLAHKALGNIRHFNDLEELLTVHSQYWPNQSFQEIYQECYLRFRALYQQIAPMF
jgi:gluconokinase